MLCFGLSLNVSAADGTEDLVTAELDAVFQRGYGDVVNDYSFTTYNYKYNGKNYTIFSCREYSSDEVISLLMLTEPFSLNSNHEYHLEYEVYHITANNDILHSAFLKFYDNNGEVIKEQQLVSVSGVYSEPIPVSVDFKPDVSDIEGGYTCRLEFYTVSAGIENFGYSEKITFIDKDDDSGWFQKIINKIEETISNIKEIHSKINQKLTELKEGIGSFFSEQWNNLQAAFSNIGTWFIELGDKFNEAIGAVGEFIVNGLRESLAWAFVPSEDFMDTFIEDIRNTYEEHFGIFAQVTLFLTDTLDYIGTLMDYDYEFTFPEVSVPIAGKTYVIIEEQTVNMEQWLKNGSVGAELYSIYQTCVWAILIFCIFKYALIVEDVILSGTSSIFTKEVMKVV